MLITKEERTAILERMQRNATLLESKTSRLKCCIYGGNGVGKTVAAVGIARKLIGPDKLIVLVDTTEGYESLRNHKGLMKGILPVTFESTNQLFVLAQAVCYNKPPFTNVGAIIFDDVDYIAKQTLTAFWHNRVETQPQSRLDPEMPARPEYLKLSFAFNEVLDEIYKQLPATHFLMTAHSREFRKDDGTLVKVAPSFSPQLNEEVMGRMLVEAFMTAKEVKFTDTATYERIIQVHPTGFTEAKSRVGFSQIRYTVKEFIDHIVQWSLEGRPEEPEAEAFKRDLQTAKTADDISVWSNLVLDDDDAPVIVP